MKKIVFFLLCLILFPSQVKAITNAKSYAVIDLDTGRILEEKNKDKKMLIASTTKIMTAILTIENTNIKTKVEVGNEILKMYGTNIYIEVGEKITIEDLLYGLILRSGNDAAMTLAITVGNTEENFVKMMNQKAKELGMNNTIFENPHGLDDDTKNYSTAYDMSLLITYAMKNNLYKKISSTKKYTTKTNLKSYIWYNRNKLLSLYEYCTGGKNGYTPLAGRTLVTSATKDNINLAIVSLNDWDHYNTHRNLYNEIFSKYKKYELLNENISKKILKNKNYYIKENYNYVLTEKEKENISIDYILNKQKDIHNKIGYYKIMLKDEQIGKVDIYQKIKEDTKISIFKKIINYLREILKKFILG